MARYARNLFYVGFAQQSAKGTGVAPVYFPKYFDGDINLNPSIEYTHYTPALSQFPELGLLEKIKPPANFTILATPQVSAALLAYAMGKEQIKGTQPGTPVSTTLSSAANAGDTVISVTDETGFSAGDLVQIVSQSDTFEDTGEIREVESVGTGQLTLKTALSYSHASGAVVEKVIKPISHKLLFADRASMPWFTTEASIGYNSAQTNPLIARLIDCRIATVTLSIEPGMPLKLAVAMHAINVEKQASETAESFENNNPFVAFHGTYTLDSGATTKIPSFELTITNVLDEDDFTNKQYREDIPVLRREASLSFVSKFDDGTRFFDTYMNAAHDALAQALKSGNFNVDFDYGNGESNRGLVIDIPNLDHVQAEVNPGTGDGTLEYACEAVVRKIEGSEFLTITVDDDNHLKYVK